MKEVFLVMAFLSLFGLGSAKAQSEKQPAGDVCTLKIEGMVCGACAARVEKEALKMDGVTAAKVDQPKGTAAITFDAAKTSPTAIAKRISDKTGFKAQIGEPKQSPRDPR